MGILKCILIACSCLVWATHAFCVEVKDTIEYRAQVWVDKIDLERYGGEASFKKNLQQMFHNTTRFWNESPNKFNYYFRFVPADELCVIFREIKTDTESFRERLSVGLICRNMTLCCFWRWAQRMKDYLVVAVEPVGSRW